MKPNKLLLVIVILSTLYSNAQSLGQDAEGFSTVMTKTTTLNLDITNNVATFSFYRELRKTDSKFADYDPLIECKDIENKEERKACIALRLKGMQASYGKASSGDKVKKNHFFTLGLDLKGETKEGLGTLLTNEKVANSASIGGLIGYNWSKVNFAHGAAEKIKKNYEKEKKLEDDEKKAADAIDPELVKKVNLATGVDLDASVAKTLKSKIKFYESRIKFLKDKSFLLATNNKNLKAIQKRIDALKKLKEIIKNAKVKAEALATKTPDDSVVITEQRELYDMLNEYKVIYFAEYKTELVFNDPYDKKAWENLEKPVGGELTTAQFKKEDIEKSINGVGANDAEISSLITLLENLNKVLKARDAFEEENTVFENTIFVTHNLIYLKGAFTGSAFKYDLANGATVIKDRFVDRVFNGYTATLGFTQNFRSYNFLGFSGALSYTNNLSGLTSTTYKFERTYPEITGGEFTSSQEIKALSGVFDTFLRYDINFDYIRLIPLLENPAIDDKQSQIYLSINPYLRHRIYENAKELKNNTIVGLGLHAYNSKDNRVMGGVFIQTNDLFGNHAGDDSTLGKRISFGVIAKFAFSGLKIEDKK